MNQRIEMLRADALHCKYSHDNDRFHTDFYTALSANGTFDPERYTEAFQYAYSRLEPMIGEGELIVGKPALYNDADVAAWCAIREQIRKSDVFCFDGGDAHMAIDYELLLKGAHFAHLFQSGRSCFGFLLRLRNDGCSRPQNGETVDRR